MDPKAFNQPNSINKIAKRIEDCQIRLDLIRAGLFHVSKEKQVLLQGEIAILKHHKQREEALHAEINGMIAAIGCY